MDNILITSAGRRVSLVKYFMNEVKKTVTPSSKVFTTDLNPLMSSACLTSDYGFKVGYFSDEDFMDTLLSMCLENKVKLVVPTLDPGLLLLAQHKERFREEGVELIVSDTGFIQICRDKRKTNTFFEKNGFKVPKKIDKCNPTFPLFIKPIDGSSSQNLHFIDHPDKLSKYLVAQEDLMWMEYLSKEQYEEYTLDLYYNQSSELCCVVPRVRLAVRGGETNKGITKKNAKLISFIRERLHTIDGAVGCLTLQIFKNRTQEDDIYGIEINPRFGGGFPLSYLAGANYPAWLIKEYLLNEKIDWFDQWEDNLLLLRHDNEMIIHDFKG